MAYLSPPLRHRPPFDHLPPSPPLCPASLPLLSPAERGQQSPHGPPSHRQCGGTRSGPGWCVSELKVTGMGWWGWGWRWQWGRHWRLSGSEVWQGAKGRGPLRFIHVDAEKGQGIDLVLGILGSAREEGLVLLTLIVHWTLLARLLLPRLRSSLPRLGIRNPATPQPRNPQPTAHPGAKGRGVIGRWRRGVGPR